MMRRNHDDDEYPMTELGCLKMFIKHPCATGDNRVNVRWDLMVSSRAGVSPAAEQTHWTIEGMTGAEPA